MYTIYNLNSLVMRMLPWNYIFIKVIEIAIILMGRWLGWEDIWFRSVNTCVQISAPM